AADELFDLEHAAARPVTPDELDRAFAAAFARGFDTALERGALSAAERERATQLRCWKYDSASWTLEGRLGPRERRWGPPDWTR
ncbi:MAG TPA: hypothetical protein VJS92_02325, partial [Candidatus Polarisedimenticolaceae bacterium]|nr:hypothetical protein [Candidatus Polarisedimenticolaceae bacterium]